MAQTRFNFSGKAVIPKKSSRPFYEERTKGDMQTRRINFAVSSSENNMAFVESFGCTMDTINTIDIDGNKMTVDWDDRFDEDVVRQVANYRKYVVDFGRDYEGRHEFITAYDMIGYVADIIEEIDGDIIVTGQISREYYKGKYYNHFRISNIYLKTKDSNNALSVVADIYYNKDCIDIADWRKEKIIRVNGYIRQYVNRDEGNKFIPQEFVFNASKINEEDEEQKKALDVRLKYLKDVPDEFVSLRWNMKLLNGAEEIEFDESQLTKAQREMVDAGISSVDDYRPNGSILGTRITEFRLNKPSLIGNYADGFLSTDLTDKEFKAEIYNPPVEENLDDVIAGNVSTLEDDDNDDLFA